MVAAAAAAASLLSAACDRKADVAAGSRAAHASDTAGGDVVTRPGPAGGNVNPGGDPATPTGRTARSGPAAGSGGGARGPRNSPTGARSGRGSTTRDPSRTAPVPSPRTADTTSGATRSPDPCVVRSVTDGDTMRCADGRRIRLLLIDAPERTQLPFGDRSRDALRRLAPAGTPLRVELDARQTDQFGRTLAYLWRDDGRMVNREMVREGWAVILVYPPNVRYIDRLRAAADSARRERKGLHEINGFECEPVEHRKGAC